MCGYRRLLDGYQCRVKSWAKRAQPSAPEKRGALKNQRRLVAKILVFNFRLHKEAFHLAFHYAPKRRLKKFPSLRS